jgi:S1-C subfamily serine protease
VTRARLAILVLALAGGLAVNAGATTAPAPATKGVVLVTTNLAYEGASAAGTGIVLTAGGEVLTNNHVIRGATTIKVVLPATHTTYAASVIGYDIADDVALLKVDGAPKLATATRGSSARLTIGQATRAVGNANGGGRLVITSGRITGLRQSITVNDDQGGTARLTGLIRTSSKLVPGDSGGPLLDAAGRAIGIDAAGSPSSAFTNADGYAIPITKALALVRQIEAGNASSLVHIGKTAFLGVSIDGTTGAVVVKSVVPGSAADVAGVVTGDVILSLDAQSVSTLADVRAVLFKHHPGDAIDVAYEDGLGNPASASLTLGDGPPQ